MFTEKSLAPVISRVMMPCGFPSFHLICGLKTDPSRQLEAQGECLHPQSLLLSSWGLGETCSVGWGWSHTEGHGGSLALAGWGNMVLMVCVRDGQGLGDNSRWGAGRTSADIPQVL